MAGNRNWTEEEHKFIIDNRNTMTMDEMADHLGRTYRAVLYRAWRGGIKVKELHRKCSYKDALPPDQWYKAELFLHALSNLQVRKGEHANIELKRLRGALLSVEKQMNR